MPNSSERSIFAQMMASFAALNRPKYEGKSDFVAGILEGTDRAAKLSTHELIKLGGRQI
jgi:hypothetical protein